MSTASGKIWEKTLLERRRDTRWDMFCWFIGLRRDYDDVHVAGSMCSTWYSLKSQHSLAEGVSRN